MTRDAFDGNALSTPAFRQMIELVEPNAADACPNVSADADMLAFSAQAGLDAWAWKLGAD